MKRVRTTERKPDEAQTDEELMSAYQKGHEEAFQVIYKRHSGRVYGYLQLKLRNRNLTDDAFQTVFLKLHQFRSRYRSTFPFAPWLFTICRNVTLDMIRSRAHIREDSDIGAIENATVEEIDSGEGIPELASLSPERRTALELRFGQDLSFEDIAKRLETSPTNVRQIVSRAVRQLRRTLGMEGKKP